VRFSASGRWFSSAVLGSTQVRIVSQRRSGRCVDVAVGVVARSRDGAEGLVDAEVVVEGLFQAGTGLGLVPRRGCVLDWTQKTLFRG